MDNGNEDRRKVGKKTQKKNKKYFYDDYDYEDERINIDFFKNNKCYEYYSKKEKENINQKFSSPRNDSQRRLFNYLKNPEYRIVLASGPAGTGKTLFSVEEGLKRFIEGKVNKVIFTRPSVSVDEKIGFLPGSLEEKMAPWVRPIFDIIHNFISPKNLEKLIEEKIFEICPLGFMRGRTFKDCWIVADEMQNSTISQMKMLLTRIGTNSKLVITGDLEQNDLNQKNGLQDFLDKIRGRRSNSINSVEFSDKDIEREEVVKEILDIYKTNTNPYETKHNNNSKKINNNDFKNNNINHLENIKINNNQLENEINSDYSENSENTENFFNDILTKDSTFLGEDLESLK